MTLTVYVNVPNKNTTTGNTILGWPDSQSRMACTRMGSSYFVLNLVTVLPEDISKPCRTFRVIAAERIFWKETVEKRAEPTGTGMGSVMSLIRP